MAVQPLDENRKFSLHFNQKLSVELPHLIRCGGEREPIERELNAGGFREKNEYVSSCHPGAPYPEKVDFRVDSQGYIIPQLSTGKTWLLFTYLKEKGRTECMDSTIKSSLTSMIVQASVFLKKKKLSLKLGSLKCQFGGFFQIQPFCIFRMRYVVTSPNHFPIGA